MVTKNKYSKKKYSKHKMGYSEQILLSQITILTIDYQT